MQTLQTLQGRDVVGVLSGEGLENNPSRPQQPQQPQQTGTTRNPTTRRRDEHQEQTGSADATGD